MIVARRSSADVPRRSNSTVRAIIPSFMTIPSTALIFANRWRPMTAPAFWPCAAFDAAIFAAPFVAGRLLPELGFFINKTYHKSIQIGTIRVVGVIREILLSTGADGGTRTLTGLLPTDFKSVASTIPPRPRSVNFRRRAAAEPRGRIHFTWLITRPRPLPNPGRSNRSRGRPSRRTCWGSGRWRRRCRRSATRPSAGYPPGARRIRRP